MMRRNVWVITVTLIIILLGINNAITYFITKQSLEDSLNHELDSAAAQIEISIENSRLGAEKYQELIGHQLRSVAIAAQFALDPDIEKVSNEQLAELSEKLGVQHITLLKRIENDIILDKSSDPKQLGISTSAWTPWHQAFRQLFEDHQVTIGWGQSLRNFWTGPYEVATSDTSKVRKWGYYYDGTTNYIIDPYVSYDMQREYEEITGAGKLIRQMMKENPSILEITGINPKTFPVGGLKTKTVTGDELDHITTQPVIFGSYSYSDPEDVANVKKVYETKEPVSLNTIIKGKHVMKRFIPVRIDKVASIVDLEGNPVDYYILSIVHDYKYIEQKLDRQFFYIGLIVAAVTVLSIIIILLTLYWFKRSRDRVATESQEIYAEEITGLFHSLAADDPMHTGHPALSVRVRSKQSRAEKYNIRFECRFSGLSELELGVKTLSLTRMLGHLVDHAIDETLKFPEEQRWITLTGSQEQSGLKFSLAYYGINTETRSGEDRFGTELSIVNQIARQYKGTVTIGRSRPDRLTITIMIPE